jgi:hypothetical protein
LTDINRIPKDLRLRKNTKVLVPIFARSPNCIDLTVEDLRKFGIEETLAYHPKLPIIYLYYCTSGGDILGKLMFTENELIFEPLNHSLKGFYNYAEGDFKKNLHMGFILSYCDIVTYPEALVTKMRSLDSENEVDTLFNQNVYLRIDVCNTGNANVSQD